MPCEHRIDHGERVMVVMDRSTIFPWQSGPEFPAELKRTPDGPGDCYTFKPDDGPLVELSATSGAFVGFYRMPEG